MRRSLSAVMERVVVDHAPSNRNHTAKRETTVKPLNIRCLSEFSQECAQAGVFQSATRITRVVVKFLAAFANSRSTVEWQFSGPD